MSDEDVIEQARRNWGLAVDELFEIDGKVKRGSVGEREVLFSLTAIVSYLVASVGALIVEAGGVGTSGDLTNGSV